MKHVVAGTAGHIDHGKTALVRALTGIDTDRLEEEKRRGISIDIGFAPLDLAPDLRVAVIDVPGHERFIKNMLAGVAGIDFVILVVAANESIKPQTREHFEICRLLRIRAGVIAVTKADLVDEDTLAVAKLEVEEFVANSFLEKAAIIPVSAATGRGMDDLRGELARLARSCASRDATGQFRLPVDRSFVMQGFGTIVTGTVIAGTVHPEDEVQVYPGGQRLRVRGVEVHGRPTFEAGAGQRAALNITGTDHADIRRGVTIGVKDILTTNIVFDCALDLLASAKPLKNRAPVHFHSGTAEVQAEIRTLDNRPLINPGSSALVRIVLRQPLLLLPGDRFIIRMFSPVVTIGGGEILDLNPPRRMRRDALVERARILATSTLQGRIEQLVSEAPSGLPIDSIVSRTGARREAIPPSILRFGDWLIDNAASENKLASFRKTLAAFHQNNPLLPGYSKEALRSKEFSDAPAFVFEAIIARDKQIAITQEYAHLAGHRISLQSDEREASARIENAFENAGLSAPSVSEVLKASGVDPNRARTLLDLLLKQKRLTRISNDLVFHASAIASLLTLLGERKGQRFAVSDFKEWTGVSRKYAIPLLEWLDRERVTRRDGEARLIL